MARRTTCRCGAPLVHKQEQHVYHCRPCWAKRMREYRANNLEKVRGITRRAGRASRARLRQRVLDSYGAVCACCAEPETRFLALDHVHGGGRAEHRERGFRTSTEMWRQCEREGYPDRFRLLCHNCNQARAIHGLCPHQEFSVLTLRAI